MLHNLFARFPGLKVLSIESGASWVVPLAHQLDHAWLLGGRSERNLGGPVAEKPSATLRRHVYVSPFVEEDIRGIAEVIGSDRIIMGSDFPHPEGNAEPGAFLEKLKAFAPADVRRIMRTNLAELLALAP